MNVARAFATIAFGCIPMLCAASDGIREDSVKLRYVPGMPALESSESLRIEVNRTTTKRRTQEAEIDRFFAAVEKILADHSISGNWQQVFPDAPFIELSIAIGTRHLKLASAHTLFERNEKLVVTDGGVEALEGRDRAAVLAQQSERYRRHRAAFEKILLLVGERTNRRIQP